MGKIAYTIMLVGLAAVFAGGLAAAAPEHQASGHHASGTPPAPSDPAAGDHAGQGPASSHSGSTATGTAVPDPGDLQVAFSIESADVDAAGPVHEGGYADVVFRVTHAGTGAPVSDLQLAAWVSRTDRAKDAEACEDRIKRYVQGLLGLHADIDLNKYFILVMNNDRTISVIDPLMGVSGITHLFDMIVLPDQGEDWVAASDGKYLFVTLPRIGRIAKVDLNSFKVVDNVEAGSMPVRIALQPGGRYLWVGNDGPYRPGVTVIDQEEMRLVSFIATGQGHHEIAFSDDGRWAFVTNSRENSLSVIDARRFESVANLPTGANPIAVAFSSDSNAAYALSETDGTLTVVNAELQKVEQVIATTPGPIALRFAHGGQWGFVSNFRENRVDIIDARRGEVVHRIPVEKQPHQITFSHQYAYVRHLGAPEVVLIKMADIGQKGLPETHKVAFGNAAPGEYRQTALADAIVPIDHMAAVVGANPAEKILFHYMEGMMVPMGSYTTYGRIPRAVRLVDRSVREIDEGLYSSKIRIPAAGSYSVSLLVKSPRFMDCYTFEAAPNVQTASEDPAPTKLHIEYLDSEKPVADGSPFSLQFRLTRSGDGQPVAGLQDVMVVSTSMPGNRQVRQMATPLPEAGHYEALIRLETPGAHLIFVSVPSLNIDSSALPYHVLKSKNPPG